MVAGLEQQAPSLYPARYQPEMSLSWRKALDLQVCQGTIATCTGTATFTGGTASLATSRKIYRTKAGGATYYLLTTIADNSTTIYTDNTADVSLPGTTARHGISRAYRNALLDITVVSVSRAPGRALVFGDRPWQAAPGTVRVG